MASILLINENKIVSRLLNLSSQKQGYDLEELNNLGASSSNYDVIFVDSDLYNEELLKNIESKFTYNYLGYIGTKKDSIPSGFDLSIEKPFLPTDFVNLIKEKIVDSAAKVDLGVKEDNIDELDLDDETELLLSEDSSELEDIDDVLSIEEDDLDGIDLSIDSSTIMSTGIVDKLQESNSNHEDLAEMVNEIDDMDIEESIDKVEDELEDIEISEPLEQDKTTVQEEDLIEEAGGVAVASVVAASVATNISQDIEEQTIQTDEFIDIDEIEIQETLGEEAEEEQQQEEIIEEIISQEVDAPVLIETTVESNDVELWIRDAVAKAITPEMIKEALDGMDVNVTLSFNSKKND